MALQFKHLPHGSAIGTGSFVFRHFGTEVVAVYLPILPDDTSTYPMYRNDSVLEFAVTDGTRCGYYAPSTESFTVEIGMTGMVIQRVEYISFDGSQFANTGVNLLGSDTVEIDFVSKKSGINVFGSWHSDNKNVYTLYASTASSYVRYSSSLYRNTPIPTNTRLVFRMTPTGDYVDGTRYHTWIEDDFDTATPCLVGWLNSSASPKLEGDVYEFTIEGKSNLIPVKVGSAYHLFDTKQWRFPTESGDLTGGSAVATPIDFPTEIYVPTASLLTMGGNPFYPPNPNPDEPDEPDSTDE